MMNILSLGAGVQSSTMALMAAEGELSPMPDYAIFADTGAEPEEIYKYLDYIESLVPFPILRVMEGEGLEVALQKSLKGGRVATAPFFSTGENGRKTGMLLRQCTSEYKVKPILKKTRDLMGLKKGQRGPKEVSVRQWIGISVDEEVRAKPNPTKWIENTFPLLEKNMYRLDCITWMREHGYKEPSKSACYFCPYHDNSTWEDMKEHDPRTFARAVAMDKAIRNGTSGVKKNLYLHRSLEPLDEVVFDPNKDQHDMFDHECEGMCGV